MLFQPASACYPDSGAADNIKKKNSEPAMKAMLFQCKCMQFSGPSGKTVASLQEGQDCKRVKLILPPVPLTNAHTKNWSWSPSASTWAPAAAQMESRKVISPS